MLDLRKKDESILEISKMLAEFSQCVDVDNCSKHLNCCVHKRCKIFATKLFDDIIFGAMKEAERIFNEKQPPKSGTIIEERNNGNRSWLII